MEVFGWYKYRVYCKLKGDEEYIKYADSPEFVGGSYAEVPFTDDFSNPDYFNTFYTTKGKDWSFSGNALHATGTTTGSDYFMTPSLRMSTKYKYNLTCTAGTFTSNGGQGDGEHDFKTLNIYFAEKEIATYEFEKCEPIYTYEFHKGEEWEIALDLEPSLFSIRNNYDSFCLIFQVVSEEGAGVDQLPEGTYYYAIFTICDGNVSRATLTNEVVLGTGTGIEGTSAEASSLYYDARQQAVVAPAGETVTIYSLEGRIVENVVSNGTVNIQGLTRGMYIVRCGNKSIKIAK